MDRHAIKASVMREGIARYGDRFTLALLNDAYGQPTGTIGAVLRRNPQSRKGKIIVAHFLGEDPHQLWPGEEWDD